MSEISANFVVESVQLGVTSETNNIVVDADPISLNVFTLGFTAAGGNNGELQFNNNGSLGGAANTSVSNGNVSFNNISNLKIQGGTNDFFLQTDGTGNLTWAPGTANVTGIGTAAGANTQIQFTDGSGNFLAAAGFTFDNSTNVFTTPGDALISGDANIVGDVNAANINAGNANVTGQLISTIGTGTPPLVVYSATPVANLSVATAGHSTTANTVVDNAQPNITSVGTLTGLTVTANIVGNITGHASTANTVVDNAQPNITSVGNLTSLEVVGNANANIINANYIYGDGSNITKISKIVNGTSNVNIATANGNVTIGVQGLNNTTIFTQQGLITNDITLNNDDIHLGSNTGSNARTVAIGEFALESSPSIRSIGIGGEAGRYNLGLESVALGYLAGHNNANAHTISIGYQAGYGFLAGSAANAIGIGYSAGYSSQGSNAIAIGAEAGSNDQGNNSIAIGKLAGYFNQKDNAIAIGQNAGYGNAGIGQSANAIAIGFNAGSNNQGANSIAIGTNAGRTDQANGSIIINATGANVGAGLATTYIKPIIEATTLPSSYKGNILFYNPSDGLISYGGFTLANGTSNIDIPTANGNIIFGVNGTANVVVVSNNTMTVSGNINAGNANITGNISTNNINVTNLTTSANANITNTLISNVANITTANIATAILANSTFTKYQETVIAGGNANGTITPDAAAGTIYNYTLTGNITLSTLANAVAGTSMTIILTQDSVGNRLLTSTMKFAGNARTLSTSANAIDIMSVFYDGSTYYASLSKGFV